MSLSGILIGRIIFLICGIVIGVTSGKTGAWVDGLIGLYSGSRHPEPFSEGSANGTDLSGTEDLLDNRTKWKLLITGYIFFAVFMIAAVIAIFTLNQKINTLYGSIQNLEETVRELGDLH